MQIYPSILETSVDDFVKQFTNVLPYFDHFQIDITDGLFVPGKTAQIEDILENVSSFMLHASGKSFEFHLMVNDYEKEIEKINLLASSIHITRILVHVGSLHTKYKILNTKYEYGIVLNPEDSVLDNWELIKQFETVQLMTVHPGTQGSPFVPEVLDKIAKLREKGYMGKILLDGAMNDKTLHIVLQQKYLPDAICPGSYFKEDVANRLNKLKKMLSE